MKKLNDTEYMYSSTRVRSLEQRLPGWDRMMALCDAKNVADVMSRLSEYGIAPAEDDLSRKGDPEAVSRAREDMLMGLLRTAFTDVEEAVPDPAVVSWLRYPYDCNNIKMALKCLVRHIDAAEARTMLFDFGSVAPEAVLETVRDGSYAALPPFFAEAAAKASTAYAETGDPRFIDTVLDRACYAGMNAAANATGVPALIRWMQVKTDLTNAVITLRILRMRRGDLGSAFLSEALLPGGTVNADFWADVYAAGEEHFRESLSAARCKHLDSFAGKLDKAGKSLSAVEKALDDTYMEAVRADARAPFGAAVAAGYILGWEAAVKNIRIVLAAKEAGLDSAAARGRVRDSYV